jgi:3-methyladenine DNA glycosylase AlkC
VLPDYVGLYGKDDFDTSMEALKIFTAFGSSEFAVREFLRADPRRTLAVMQAWSLDESEHVRRLASEGSRPRLPWSFRLDALMADPELAAPILDNLKADPSLHVRKSVANHLNDISKLHPAWVMERLEGWPLDNPNTAWITRHALRTLIKRGDRRALAVIGAGEKPKLLLHDLKVSPKKLRLGERMSLSFGLKSTARKSQRLVVDYTVHYVKKSGASSAKVFNLETAVGRARLGRCGRVWVGATTQQATACKASPRPQAWPQRLNRVRSAVTQKVIAVVTPKVGIHAALRADASGQLRFPGSGSRSSPCPPAKVLSSPAAR